jgi:type IV pilus assembly protein PilA
MPYSLIHYPYQTDRMTSLEPVRRSLGFSLIETMIAVGVAGVLAAIGLPWYGDTVRKSKVAEGVTLAAPAKAKVAGELLGLERVNQSSGWAYSCGRNQAGEQVCPIVWETIASNPSKNISSIARAGNTVVVNFSPEIAGTDGTLYSLLMVGTQNAAGVNWECLAGSAAASELSRLSSGSVPVQAPLPAKWAPAHCRTI